MDKKKELMNDQVVDETASEMVSEASGGAASEPASGAERLKPVVDTPAAGAAPAETERAGEKPAAEAAPVGTERAGEKPAAGATPSAKPAGKENWGSQVVTRKFMAIALAVMLLVNAGLTAGVLALSARHNGHGKAAMQNGGRPGSEMYSDKMQGGDGQMMLPGGHGRQNGFKNGQNGQMTPPTDQNNQNGQNGQAAPPADQNNQNGQNGQAAPSTDQNSQNNQNGQSDQNGAQDQTIEGTTLEI